MTGYKATDAEMKCQGFQFKLGEWYEHSGEVVMCASGFHFCLYPSGPLCFYSASDSRVFKVEAEQVLEIPTEAGADFKLVAKRIRLVEEITPGKTGNDKSNTGNWNTGYSNTGNWNTGDRNTGNCNTGNWNTGNWNTGDSNTGNCNTGNSNTGNWNTGYSNTGNWNTGNSNTGNWNTGDSNTGNCNTGNWNTGYSNTGNSNTGNCNTGNWNTGNWNTGDRNSGFFCLKEPKVISFDVQTNLTFEVFLNKYPQAYKLGELLEGKDLIDFEQFEMIPGITKEKLADLHKKHLKSKEKKLRKTKLNLNRKSIHSAPSGEPPTTQEIKP
jgi:hypothetical protein